MSETNGKIKRYSLRCKQEPLLMENADTGEMEHYVLQEMSGTDRDGYANAMSGRVRRQGDVETVTNYTGLHANLISRCLHRAELEIDENTDDVRILRVLGRVKEDEVQKYPASVQADLFAQCQLICGLNAAAREQAKNS